MKFKRISFLLLLAFLFSFLFSSFSFFKKVEILAQSDETTNLLQEKQRLEEELKKLEEEIKRYESDISKTEKQKRDLKNAISLLKQKIESLDLQIKANNLKVKNLSLQIDDTQKSINKTSQAIEEKRKKLAEILRTIYETDKKSPLEILLSEDSLSSFFDDLLYLENLNNKNKEILETIKDLKVSLEKQEEILSQQKKGVENLLKIQILQQEESKRMQEEKRELLKMTDAQYQKLLSEKTSLEEKAAQIRKRIFELIGVPKAPTFGEAYQLAKEIEKITGVRPAFLLAVLHQESNIGKNVGQCFLKNPSTGEGMEKNSGIPISNVMNPTRDVPYFLQITKSLGRDPYSTPVSCPIPSVGGWGGAMGPAQFIPSTWVNYAPRVSQILGRTANPWEIKDSFLAAALYLADYGAAQKTPQAEWQAAMIYFSGTTDPAYSFYGNQVMAKARSYEEDIKILESQSLTSQKTAGVFE
jgi:peptidoglycan hydrolase CwlO-like protein